MYRYVPKDIQYVVLKYMNNIPVEKKQFKYQHRMEIALKIMAKYTDPNDIVIIDRFENVTRYKSYY